MFPIPQVSVCTSSEESVKQTAGLGLCQPVQEKKRGPHMDFRALSPGNKDCRADPSPPTSSQERTAKARLPQIGPWLWCLQHKPCPEGIIKSMRGELYKNTNLSGKELKEPRTLGWRDAKKLLPDRLLAHGGICNSR